jgi:hypothetical protein
MSSLLGQCAPPLRKHVRWQRSGNFLAATVVAAAEALLCAKRKLNVEVIRK